MRVSIGLLAALVRGEVELAETDPAGKGEFVGIGGVPVLEFRITGFVGGRHVLCQELQLLGHAPLDDGVVLVQAHRDSFAVEHFLLHLVFNHPAKLFSRWCALPLGIKESPHGEHIVRRQANFGSRRTWRQVRFEIIPGGKERCAQQQEVEQRLAQPATEGHDRDLTQLRRLRRVG